MLSVRAVTSLEAFEGLQKAWDELLGETASNQIFLTWTWLYTWAKHYVKPHQLLILLVYEASRLVGIAPLYIVTETRYGMLRLRRVTFLGSGEVCSAYLDLIAPERKKAEVVSAIMSHLYGEAGNEWDLMTWTDLPDDSSSIDHLHHITGESGKVLRIVEQTCCPVARLDPTADAFVQRLSANERYNLRRKRIRLEKAGRVEWVHTGFMVDIERDFSAFVELHQRRWRGKGMAGCFGNPRFLAFHREIAEVLNRKGWLRLHFLRLNGDAIAGIYGFSYGGRYSFYLPGFDPTSVPEASPGILLLFECVTEAIRDGCREFDFLRGAAGYKMVWADGVRRSLTLSLYNRSARAAAFSLAESGKELVKVLAR